MDSELMVPSLESVHFFKGNWSMMGWSNPDKYDVGYKWRHDRQHMHMKHTINFLSLCILFEHVFHFWTGENKWHFIYIYYQYMLYVLKFAKDVIERINKTPSRLWHQQQNHGMNPSFRNENNCLNVQTGAQQIVRFRMVFFSSKKMPYAGNLC